MESKPPEARYLQEKISKEFTYEAFSLDLPAPWIQSQSHTPTNVSCWGVPDFQTGVVDHSKSVFGMKSDNETISCVVEDCFRANLKMVSKENAASHIQPDELNLSDLAKPWFAIVLLLLRTPYHKT